MRPRPARITVDIEPGALGSDVDVALAVVYVARALHGAARLAEHCSLKVAIEAATGEAYVELELERG